MRHTFALFASLAPAVSASAAILNANPGPANNGLSAGNPGVLFDLTSTSNVLVTDLTTACGTVAGGAFSFEVWTRVGTALGGPVASGPGSSSVGWTNLGVANGTQGATSSGISLLVNIPDIAVSAGQTTGVCLRWLSGGGPRYFGTGTPPLENYTDGTLSLLTGDARSAVFTPTGTFFTSRALVGSLTYSAVPSPGAAGLFAIAGLAAVRRRR